MCSLFPRDDSKILFADLGTGSGAISIALCLARLKWKGLATDIDKKALEIASKNLFSISPDSDLSFFCGDWWEPLSSFKKKIDFVCLHNIFVFGIFLLQN